MVPDSKLLTITTMVLLLQVKFILNNEGKFPKGEGEPGNVAGNFSTQQ